MAIKPYQVKEVLERMWIELDMSTPEIAEVLGCSSRTVQYWINKHSLEKTKPWHDRSVLYEEYVVKKNTSTTLAKRWGCNSQTILNALESHGIEKRTKGESQHYDSLSGPANFSQQDGYPIAYSIHYKESEQVRLHRLLAVAEYGFDALYGMYVHHDNGVKWDNRPENIELMTPEDHGELHATEYWEQQ